MNAQVSASNLSQAVTELSVEWQHTKALWRDSKSEEFEARYLDVLVDHVNKTRPVMDEIANLLRKVISDCE